MTELYQPERVYLLYNQKDGISLGELVDHRWADGAPGVEQACVYVALVNSAGEIYIQHRAATKRLWPDRKTISASGHVDPGESFEQAAVREIREELGIELSESDLCLLGSFTGLSHCGPVYEVRSEQSPRPEPRELDEEQSGFVCTGELKQMLADSDLFTPSGARAIESWFAAQK